MEETCSTCKWELSCCFSVPDRDEFFEGCWTEKTKKDQHGSQNGSDGELFDKTNQAFNKKIET
jgi:hypothetical protein